MAIRVLEVVDINLLKEELEKRGWKEGSFNKKPAMIKDLGSYLWLALLKEKPCFISLPSEEDSKLHREGMRRLQEEVKELSEALGFTIPIRLGGSNV
ncbi:hypothetical protein [Hydrogenobacter thermophilus]|uniref:hypothetical protein n=1 Tax=Hydrogenobacter thermophilus TaxID=940 RepID=UPI0030F557B0